MNKVIVILFCYVISHFQLYSQNDTPALIFKLVKEKNVAGLLMENEWNVKNEGRFIESKTINSIKYTARKDNDTIIIKYYKGESNYIIYKPYHQESYEFFFNIMNKSNFLEIENNYNKKKFRKNDLMCVFIETYGYKSDNVIKLFNANEQQNRLEKIDKERIEFSEGVSSLILLADSLSLLNKYNESILKYNQIIDEIENTPEYFTNDIDLFNLKNEIINKISIIHEKQKEEDIQIFIKKGNELFNEGSYNKSLEIFNSVLSLERNNKIAKTKISEIENIQSILRNRRSETFSYIIIEKNRYLNLKNNLSKKLERSIDNNENGTINFACLLSFDTLGVSELNISCNDKILKDYISQLYKTLNPYPPKIKGFHISTKDDININLNWTTEKISFNFNQKSLTSNVINASNSDMYANNEKTSIEDYITDNGFGRYNFKIKKKKINNTSYNDYTLQEYSVRGPSNALYSIILPGLGSYRTSYGEKGKNRYKNIILFSAVAYGSKLLSESQYEKYQESTIQSDMDTYYENATIYNTVSQISWGIAGTIYISDIITALKIGNRNKKNSKRLRQQLRKEGEIKIITNPISIK